MRGKIGSLNPHYYDASIAFMCHCETGGRACTPKCLPAVGRPYGTQAWQSQEFLRSAQDKAPPLLFSRNGNSINAFVLIMAK